MHKSILYALLTIVISSCSVGKTIIEPRNEIYESEVGEKVIEKEIGEAIVIKEIKSVYDAILIKNDLVVKPAGVYTKIKKGTIYLNKYKFKEFDLFANDNNPGVYIAISVRDNHEALFYNFNLYKSPNIEYEDIKEPDPENKNNFRKEFIYNGRVGSALKFIYREYSENLARPAFTQELQYDLDESKTIGFKGLRIKIISTTNTSIKYIIENGFN